MDAQNGAHSEKENFASNEAAAREAGAAIFGAHRDFITSCVEQLEVHTWMLSQAEDAANQAGSADGAASAALEGAGGGKPEGLTDYVASLEALLLERQAALATLQAQLQSFRHTVEATP